MGKLQQGVLRGHRGFRERADTLDWLVAGDLTQEPSARSHAEGHSVLRAHW
jgi:hypothetical protein